MEYKIDDELKIPEDTPMKVIAVDGDMVTVEYFENGLCMRVKLPARLLGKVKVH